MPTLTELAAKIVSAQASSATMTSEELISSLNKVHETLKKLESVSEPSQEIPATPAMTGKQSIKKNEIICLECGKGGFTTLKRHLTHVHSMPPSDYRKKHGIPASVTLAAKSFVEKRKAFAAERDLSSLMAKARDARGKQTEEKSKMASPKKKVAKKRSPTGKGA